MPAQLHYSQPLVTLQQPSLPFDCPCPCRRLLPKGWTGWVCYNDDPPAGSAGRGGMAFGHCKGILAWSRDRLGWLVHSVPCWPAAFSDAAVSPLVSSGIRCGQSFLWLTMARTPELTRDISGAPPGAVQLCGM